MKQIQFYQGIQKKVVITDHVIIPGQTYKCVVFSSYDKNDAHTIYTIAEAKLIPPPPCPHPLPPVGTVEFTFETYQTATLQLGDNNLAVYDVTDPDKYCVEFDPSDNALVGGVLDANGDLIVSNDFDANDGGLILNLATNSEFTLYKVYEARVFTSKSIAQNDQPSLNYSGNKLILGKMKGNKIVLANGETIDNNGKLHLKN